MAFEFLRLLTLILLVVSFASADDEGAVMAKFASQISPTPASWTGTNFCNWDNIRCLNGHVTEIHLDRKKLAGTLPSNLNSLTQLKTLFLQGNSFSGEFPSLANLINLQTVYLDNNNFSSIPDGAFSGLNSLRDLSLTSNSKLSPWKFPSELAQSGGLVTLYAGSCSLAGSIPDIFGSFPALKDLRLSFNSLSGSLPSSFAGSEIQNLWLNGNKQSGSGGLSGSIDVIGAMNQLSQVWLHGNSFTGSIPDLTNCTNIIDLQLRENQLTGIVPPSLPKLPNLLNVSLQNNHLQGPYPAFKSDVTIEDATMNSFCTNQPGVACDAQVTTLITAAGAFGYPMTLAESWKGNSACNWPFVSCNSGNVIVINLQKQQLNGSISPAFADLKYLKNLYLNDNNLTGTIPDNLATLTSLLFLNVSNNNISGQVPKFRAGVTVDSKANPFIGRDINPGGGGSSGSNSTDSGGKSKKSSISPGLVAGLVIGVVILVGIVLFILYKCYIRRRDRKFGKVQNPEFGAQMVKTDCMGGVNGYAGLSSEVQSQASVDHNEMPVYEGGNVVISIHVLREVTNNFSDENVLGRGGFGIVYKGELHDGTKIAVKRMESNAMGTKGMNEFQAEIAVLTKVRHRHLVALLGYCINDNERLLVYEYMPQGTLGQHLFEWKELGFPPLTWKQRVTIALDVARGVEYLHSLAQSSFIHRDLKPNNILLGDDLRAKVADFGLVKNAPDGGKYSMVTRLAGTFGYLAPEYAATGRVTIKVDVYAFGVILMEMITGRKVLDQTMPEESCHLVTWFRRILINKENIRKAIDDILDPDDETYEIILKVAELAGHCTARDPYQRPDMGHSVNILGPLVEQWRPACQEEENGYGIDLDMSLPQTLRRWQANEGTSSSFSDVSFSQTQSSIPAKPSGFPDSFRSTDCR